MAREQHAHDLLGPPTPLGHRMGQGPLQHVASPRPLEARVIPAPSHNSAHTNAPNDGSGFVADEIPVPFCLRASERGRAMEGCLMFLGAKPIRSSADLRALQPEGHLLK
uniref:Uncharacterized protein n=1 Tax=Eutreptiella gymnastica TaxID=73025 RepID=A0A7S4G0H6_9EUGL|mmetsp:Transcript_47474/g.78076  ORF Transcript_47474/g.78076 Transcript_47474/m.78076 type:complete len:109 (-) Transcript_47474:96-422(-)